MKYIRTKDGIYRVAENIMLATSPMRYAVLDKNEDIRIGSVSIKEVINQADTIEELCDEFVLDHPLFAINCKCLYHSFEKAKYGIKKRGGDAHDLYDFTIYGAIWTDKGLIYVAKMNDKGELELL